MFEAERAKIREQIEQIQSEEKVVIPSVSKYDKIREELQHIKKKDKKNEVVEPIVQINEKETEEEPVIPKAEIDPKEKTRNRMEGLNGTVIEEDGDDVTYTIPDDDDEENERLPDDQLPNDQLPEDLIENSPNDSQQYVINNGNNGHEPPPADQDQEGFKSEIAKQLFDVPRKKILQRTELPRRMILPMSMQKTAIFLATQPYTKNCETGPEHWMYEYGYLMLSAGRKVRMEGMAAFQPVAEGGSSENINF